jgi:tRNA 2-thiouridine synthesizing protein E
MTLATILDKEVHVDAEGFMTEYDEWSEDLANQLAANIGIELTEPH